MLKKGSARTLKRLKQEIACVGGPAWGGTEDTEESKVEKRRNSYNEEFDPGSG